MAIGDQHPWHRERGARISDCGRFRTLLWRSRVLSIPGVLVPTCAFVMLNPSTADGLKDDPTIRKCMAYAERWGFARLEVVNLYSYRTSSPKVLVAAGYPVGPDNDLAIVDVARRAGRIVLAWGNHAQEERAAEVKRLIANERRERTDPAIVALKWNQNGSPTHPSRQPLNATLLVA